MVFYSHGGEYISGRPGPILRSLDHPFLLMADHDALSLFYDESMGYTSSIERHLEAVAMYVSRGVKRNFELIRLLGVISQRHTPDQKYGLSLRSRLSLQSTRQQRSVLSWEQHPSSSRIRL